MAEGEAPAETPSTQNRRQRGLVSRVWKGIFGGCEDVEKLLQALSKEEQAVRARLRRRARASRQSSHNVLALAGALEIVAVGYAIMTTRSPDLSWQMRAARVLPMFLIPALAALIYSTITSLTKMLDNRDQHTLEKLRAERQDKIDELKEKTNYYMTQQLIQRYDLDPAAKAAAASVLASKLGADSGLRVFVGDDSSRDAIVGKSNENNIGQTAGLRQRKPTHLSNGTGQTHSPEPLDASNVYDFNEESLGTPNQRSVEHFRGPAGNDGGWLARVAALLVGEDPTQCYALICGNCHTHNGLARKEDFAFITYYCPHCNALNGSGQHDDQDLVSNSSKESPSSRSEGSIGPHSSKESPRSRSDNDIGHTGASLASSSGTSPVVSNLRTVEELPAEDSVEKEKTVYIHDQSEKQNVERLQPPNIYSHLRSLRPSVWYSDLLAEYRKSSKYLVAHGATAYFFHMLHQQGAGRRVENNQITGKTLSRKRGDSFCTRSAT